MYCVLGEERNASTMAGMQCVFLGGNFRMLRWCMRLRCDCLTKKCIRRGSKGHCSSSSRSSSSSSSSRSSISSSRHRSLGRGGSGRGGSRNSGGSVQWHATQVSTWPPLSWRSQKGRLRTACSSFWTPLATAASYSRTSGPFRGLCVVA